MMKKVFYCFAACIILFTSCTQNEITLQKNDILDVFRKNINYIEENKKSLEFDSINDYFQTLTDEEKVAQLFLVSLDGNKNDQIQRIINTNKTAPGGYLLFAFNIQETSDEMIEFLSELNKRYIEKGNIPPFISIDHEGGVVNRLRNICSKLPSQLSIAKKFSYKEALNLYELQGEQLKNLGIHVNIAPVVEILTDQNIEFLDDRSFGNKESVLTYSKAQIKGMSNAEVLPVLKHFPGNTNNDPHTGLPILDCDEDTLTEIYLTPFYKLDNITESGVLVAHTVAPVIDEHPACLSEKVINLLNSKSEKFDGLIFSDDLLMKALIKNGYPVEKSLIAAINAGVNILMISTGSFDEYEDIVLSEYEKDSDFKEKVDKSVKKILEWKVSCNLLKRNVVQTGFFTYESEITLPDPKTPDQISLQKDLFDAAYSKAIELYNEVWWK